LPFVRVDANLKNRIRHTGGAPLGRNAMIELRKKTRRETERTKGRECQMERSLSLRRKTGMKGRAIEGEGDSTV